MSFEDFLLSHYELVRKSDILPISSVCTHSNKVKNASLFICLKGQKSDGHNHLKQAVQQGAGALLLEKVDSIPPQFKGMIFKYKKDPHLSLLLNEFYNTPSEKLFTVGVTGTNGKTSVSYLLEHIFQCCGWPTGVIGTVNQHFKDRGWPSTLTCPEPVELFERLNDFVHLGAKAMVLEVSSHALAQNRIAGLDFNALVFTNLSLDHLDYHNDMESYFQSKQKLFHDFCSKNSFCLVNQDDAYGRRLKKEIQKPCWTYGQDKQADFCFKIKKSYRNSTQVELKSSFGVQEFLLPLVGDYNVYNAVSALSCALLTGFKMEACLTALKTFPGVPGRMEVIKTNKRLPFEVMIDYAHTPSALELTLKTLKAFGKKIILLVGCGGDRDKKKRPQMADIALKFADQIFWTTDNPRFEEPEQIVQEALGHLTMKQKTKITVELNRRLAIEQAIQQASQGDIVLIAGKGHESLQIIQDHKQEFSDKKVAVDCLKKLNLF